MTTINKGKRQFASLLLEALNVEQKMVTSINIKVPANDMVMVTIDFLIDSEQQGNLLKLMQKYYLMEVPDGKNET